MKACVTTGVKRQMDYREVPMPVVGPTDVLLKTKCALICGSDLEYLDAIHGDIEAGQVRGHEFVAEVVDVGSGVSGWQPGDRAVPISFTSNYGCWADYFVASTQGVQKVPAHVPDEQAVFVEAMHTGFGAVEASGVKPGQSAVIIGTGKIGLLAVMSAKVTGAAPIIAIDIDQSHLEKALTVGAHAAFNASEVDVVAEVKRLTSDEASHPALHGPDVVIVCARQGRVLNQALDMSKQGTHIVLAGFIPPTEIDPAIFLMKQLVMSGIMAGRQGQNRINGEKSLYMLAHEQMDPTPLLTDTMEFRDIQKAIDSTYAGENLAILLTP